MAGGTEGPSLEDIAASEGGKVGKVSKGQERSARNAAKNAEKEAKAQNKSAPAGKERPTQGPVQQGRAARRAAEAATRAAVQPSAEPTPSVGSPPEQPDAPHLAFTEDLQGLSPAERAKVYKTRTTAAGVTVPTSAIPIVKRSQPAETPIPSKTPEEPALPAAAPPEETQPAITSLQIVVGATIKNPTDSTEYTVDSINPKTGEVSLSAPGKPSFTMSAEDLQDSAQRPTNPWIIEAPQPKPTPEPPPPTVAPPPEPVPPPAPIPAPEPPSPPVAPPTRTVPATPIAASGRGTPPTEPSPPAPAAAEPPEEPIEAAKPLKPRPRIEEGDVLLDEDGREFTVGPLREGLRGNPEYELTGPDGETAKIFRSTLEVGIQNETGSWRLQEPPPSATTPEPTPARKPAVAPEATMQFPQNEREYQERSQALLNELGIGLDLATFMGEQDACMLGMAQLWTQLKQETGINVPDAFINFTVQTNARFASTPEMRLQKIYPILSHIKYFRDHPDQKDQLISWQQQMQSQGIGVQYDPRKFRDNETVHQITSVRKMNSTYDKTRTVAVDLNNLSDKLMADIQALKLEPKMSADVTPQEKYDYEISITLHGHPERTRDQAVEILRQKGINPPEPTAPTVTPSEPVAAAPPTEISTPAEPVPATEPPKPPETLVKTGKVVVGGKYEATEGTTKREYTVTKIEDGLATFKSSDGKERRGLVKDIERFIKNPRSPWSEIGSPAPEPTPTAEEPSPTETPTIAGATPTENPSGSETTPATENPLPIPRTPSDVVREAILANRTSEVEKEARRLANEQFEAEIAKPGFGNLLHRMRISVAKDYYIQKWTQQAREAMLENNNIFVGMDLMKGAVTDANRLVAQEKAAGSATLENIRLMAQNRIQQEGTRITEAQGAFKTAVVTEVLKPLVNQVTPVSQEQMQQALRAFVASHANGQGFSDQEKADFNAVFGQGSNDYNRLAEYFATDMVSLVEQVRTDIAANEYALEQIEDHIKITLANTAWAGQTRVDRNLVDRAVSWAQGGTWSGEGKPGFKNQMRSYVLNPTTIGVAASLVTFGTVRAVGAAGRAANLWVPGVGIAVGGGLTAVREANDIKRQRELVQLRGAYSQQSERQASEGRGEQIERYNYDIASVDQLINGGGRELAGGQERASIQQLKQADLSVEANRVSLLRRISEIGARQDFSVQKHADLVAYESREKTQQGRLELTKAVVDARLALKNAGMSDQQLTDQLLALNTQWQRSFAEDKTNKDRGFKAYQISEAAFAGLKAGAVGWAGGLIGQEVMAQVGRNVMGMNIGRTVLENFANQVGRGVSTVNGVTTVNIGEALSPISPGPIQGFENISEWAGGGGNELPFNRDSVKELYQHPGNMDMANGGTLAVGPDHAASFLGPDGKTPLPGPPMHITEDGRIIVSGKFENLPQDMRNLTQGWEHKTAGGNEFNIHEKLAGLAKSGEHQTFIHGDTVIDINTVKGDVSINVDPMGDKIGVYGHVKPDGAIDFDRTFAENPKLTDEQWAKVNSTLKNDGWGLTTETTPGKTYADINEYLREKGELEPTSRDSWHDNDTPMRRVNGRLIGADGKELQFYHRVLPDGRIELDFSKMESQLKSGKWTNWDSTVDNQYNRLANDIVKKPDGSSAFKNFEIMVTPNAEDDTKRLTVVLNEANHPELSQGKVWLDPKSDLGKSFFNLDANGKPVMNQFGNFQNTSFIEVAHKQTDGLRSILSTTVGPGEVIPPPPAPMEVLHATAPNTFELIPPSETPPPPIIPIPWIPRTHLEEPRMVGTPPPRYPYGSRAPASPEQMAEFEQRRSPRLNANKRAQLDANQEADWYFEQQRPEYVQELRDLNAQIGEPMTGENRLTVTMPVAAHQEEANIYRTLQNYTDQRDSQTGQMLDKNTYEVLIFLNHPENKTPDGTKAEIERFRRDNPDVKVRVAEKVFKPEEVRYGRIVKYLNDLALLRSRERTTPINPDLIMVTNDADSTKMSRTYISDIIHEFDKPENKNTDALLGKLEWSQEAYDRYPVFHATNRFAQFIDTVYRHGTYPTLGSPGGNFALRSSIYAGVGGYFSETGAGADQDLSRMIRFARHGQLARIPVNEYPIRYLNRAWLESNPRRGLDTYKSGKPILGQWDDFNQRMSEDDPARLSRWQVDADNEPLDQFNTERLERELNETLAYYGMNANDPAVPRALAWMGVQATIENGKLKITDVAKLIENLRHYQEEGRSGIKNERAASTTPLPPPPPTSRPTGPRGAAGQVIGALNRLDATTANVIRAGAQRVQSAVENVRQTPSLQTQLDNERRYIQGVEADPRYSPEEKQRRTRVSRTRIVQYEAQLAAGANPNEAPRPIVIPSAPNPTLQRVRDRVSTLARESAIERRRMIRRFGRSLSRTLTRRP